MVELRTPQYGRSQEIAVTAGPDRSCTPAFDSLALRDIPLPDHADVVLVPLPAGAPEDAETWARAVFDPGGAPAWIRALFGVRQALVGLIGVHRAPRDVFAVREVAGQEALIAADAGHLDFRAGVAVDPVARMVRVTTTVRLHGVRGRIYFAPVRLLHAPITLAMLRAAATRLTPAGPS
jgi:hypothetical protein